MGELVGRRTKGSRGGDRATVELWMPRHKVFGIALVHVPFVGGCGDLTGIFSLSFTMPYHSAYRGEVEATPAHD